ncbi:MgtC/SapB family protein [Litorisediminicola beolgyonensis]|uniref:Protein MgtC n=1 Tax=Litorisediminicola beolgyonensis TaxID=1173614 RepID=A0ABW3ZD45_9RHOB
MIDLIQQEFLSTFSATPLPVALTRLVCALIMGAILGFERERHGNSAGLRTHMLIATGACLFTLIAFDLIELPENEKSTLRFDPIRLIEAVTSGVAFLAAGSIITQGTKVAGLTTGAGMWMAGAVGLCCGIGNIPLAALATALTLVVLWMIRHIMPGDGTDSL